MINIPTLFYKKALCRNTVLGTCDNLQPEDTLASARTEEDWERVPTEEELLADELLEEEEMEAAHRQSLKNKGSFLADLSQNNLTVYPNPGKGVFTVQSGSPMVSVVLRNMMGQEIGATIQATDSKNLNIEIKMNAPSGMYVLEVKTEKNMTVRKLVVE